MAENTNCFKNITHTLTKRHQMRQSWEFSGEEILSQDDRAVTRTRVSKFGTLPETMQTSINDVLCDTIGATEDICTTKHIIVDCVSYKVNGVYVIGTIEEETIPQFLHVKHVCCIREVWILCGYYLVLQHFDHHLHSYAVAADTCLISCRPQQILDHTAHDFFTVDDQMYVSMRYCVVPR